jgi:hypothetical protein
VQNKRVGVVQSFVSFFVYVEFMGLSDLRFKAIYSQIEKFDYSLSNAWKVLAYLRKRDEDYKATLPRPPFQTNTYHAFHRIRTREPASAMGLGRAGREPSSECGADPVGT